MGKKELKLNAVVVCERCRTSNPKRRRLRKRNAVYLPKTLTRQGLYYHRECAPQTKRVVDEFLAPL